MILRKQFAEFFAGIGLVRAGLEPSGWDCAYANDIDAKKKQMYEGHFGPSPEFIAVTYGIATKS